MNWSTDIEHPFFLRVGARIAAELNVECCRDTAVRVPAVLQSSATLATQTSSCSSGTAPPADDGLPMTTI